MSKNQKLNTKISTEDVLIGADDVIPQMLWTKYLIEAQGYVIDKNIMYQDNLIAMLLETNGNKSSTKKANHIQVRYFFIKCQVATNDFELNHCSTTKMLEDHFTKPLQRGLFHIFRAELVNLPEDADITDMGWDSIKTEKGVSWKLHNELYPACPQGCVGGYETGTSMPDVSASGVLLAHSPARNIVCT